MKLVWNKRIEKVRDSVCDGSVWWAYFYGIEIKPSAIFGFIVYRRALGKER